MAAEAALARMRAAAEAVGAEGDATAQVRFHQADADFHEALALASGNRVLSYLFEAMARPLRESFYASRRGQQLRGLSLADSVAAHAHILACVSSGDAKGAGDAMSKLIDDAERDIRAAYSPASLALREWKGRKPLQQRVELGKTFRRRPQSRGAVEDP